jgi:hypothetical protein
MGCLLLHLQSTKGRSANACRRGRQSSSVSPRSTAGCACTTTRAPCPIVKALTGGRPGHERHVRLQATLQQQVDNVGGLCICWCAGVACSTAQMACAAAQQLVQPTSMPCGLAGSRDRAGPQNDTHRWPAGPHAAPAAPTAALASAGAAPEVCVTSHAQLTASMSSCLLGRCAAHRASSSRALMACCSEGAGMLLLAAACCCLLLLLLLLLLRRRKPKRRRGRGSVAQDWRHWPPAALSDPPGLSVKAHTGLWGRWLCVCTHTCAGAARSSPRIAVARAVPAGSTDATSQSVCADGPGGDDGGQSVQIHPLRYTYTCVAF